MGRSDSGDGSSDFSEHTVINSSSLKLSYKKDVRRYPCIYNGCFLIFTRPNRLAAHLRVHTGEKPFPCKVSGCDKAYTNKSHLSRHVKSTHQPETSASKKTHRCSKCHGEFSTNQNLKKHMSRIHNEEYPYWCELCQSGYKKKNQLTAHMFLHTGIKQFKCDGCTETFASLLECNKHRRNHRTYKCHCGQIFRRWTEILKHRRTAHNFEEYHCDICKRVFKSKGHIHTHMKIHSIDDQKNVFPCPHDCSKFYSTKYNLEHHIMSVHKEMTFNCTFSSCLARLSTKAKLEQHIMKNHVGTTRPIKNRKTPRLRRKDIGQLKRSTAVRLAGVMMPIALEKSIIAGIDVPISEIDVLVPEIGVLVPEMEVPISEIDVRVPETNVPIPEIDALVPEIGVLVPEIKVPISEIDIPTSEIDVPISEIDVPISEIDVPISEIDVLVPEIEVPVSEIDVPTSEIDVPISEIDVLVPEIGVLIPEIDIPTPGIDLPIPVSNHVNVSSYDEQA